MEPETEIVSDAPVRSRRKAAKKAAPERREAVVGMSDDVITQREIAAILGVGVGTVARDQHPAAPNGARDAQIIAQAMQPEEIRELEVVRVVPNPRMVLASYEKDGQKRVVRVVVGVNRNFKVRMRLKAQRGSDENTRWRLIGRRPRLPGRW